MDLNKAMLIGNLTRDPEVRTTPSGQNVANFGIATNRYWKDQSGGKQSAVEYHNIVVWGKLADICGQYLHKGKKVYVEGRLQTRDWEGQDGVKRKTTEIVADNMIMLSGRGDGAPQPIQQPAVSAPSSMSAPAPAPAAPEPSFPNEPTLEPIPESPSMPSDSDNEEVKVEDIPF